MKVRKDFDEAIIDLLDRLAAPGSGFEIIEREC